MKGNQNKIFTKDSNAEIHLYAAGSTLSRLCGLSGIPVGTDYLHIFSVNVHYSRFQKEVNPTVGFPKDLRRRFDDCFVGVTVQQDPLRFLTVHGTPIYVTLIAP